MEQNQEEETKAGEAELRAMQAVIAGDALDGSTEGAGQANNAEGGSDGIGKIPPEVMEGEVVEEDPVVVDARSVYVGNVRPALTSSAFRQVTAGLAPCLTTCSYFASRWITVRLQRRSIATLPAVGASTA